MAFLQEQQLVEDDGLPIDEVGEWSLEKYRLVSSYASIFASSMKNKWDCLVYLDIFSGSGRVKIRDTGDIVNATPLVLLDQDNMFNRYIFNDASEKYSSALRSRIENTQSSADYFVLNSDANSRVDRIFAEMPRPHGGFKVLTFCFVDPYRMSALKFSTIKKLSERYMDFLILIPSGMDANRNESNYMRTDNTTVDDFLGHNDWRSRWEKKKVSHQSFGQFIVEEYHQSMSNLDYKIPDESSIAPIRNSKKSVLYHLVLYSRKDLGKKFWDQVMLYSSPQQDLGF